MLSGPVRLSPSQQLNTGMPAHLSAALILGYQHRATLVEELFGGGRHRWKIRIEAVVRSAHRRHPGQQARLLVAEAGGTVIRAMMSQRLLGEPRRQGRTALSIQLHAL